MNAVDYPMNEHDNTNEGQIMNSFSVSAGNNQHTS